MKRLTLVLLAAAAALSACTDQRTLIDIPPPDAPIADVFRMSGPTPSLGSLDATYAQFAREIPGFGGLFFDERGRPNVYMVPTRGTAMDAGTLAGQLNDRLRVRGMGDDISAGDLIIHPGRYDFEQLHAFHNHVRPVLAVPGVVFTDADETTNTIRIGIEAGTPEPAILGLIMDLGVPPDAVTIVETEPIHALQVPQSDLGTNPVPTNLGSLPTLRDVVRPTAGGLQIWRFIPPSTASICTLGFNASAPSVSQGRLMFTNSHCTAVRGQVTGTEWVQQPLVLPLNVIAVEVEDPPFFTNATDPGCPAGRVCRFSDAAAGEYVIPNEDVAHGRTMAPYPGTIVLPTTTRHLRVAEEATSRPVVGRGLMKVGRTSGLTAGPVIATCANTNVAGTNITMLCQEHVLIGVAGGDSGSPVVEAMDDRAPMTITPNQPVRLHGLLWGGSSTSYVYSSMLNIRMDFPGPWVVN